MGDYGRIWDYQFHSEVTDFHKISFCTTCMDRLYNLKKTLPRNIKDNESYPNLEFVILDYNSKDGLGNWIKKNMMEHIESGRVVYYRTIEPKYFSMAHSRNIVFKVSSGDIVNNLDADNYTVKYIDKDHPPPIMPWAFFINKMANECSEKVIFAKGKRSMHGRIGFYKKEFIEELGGYDEGLDGYGHDDHDLVLRAWALSYIMYWWGGTYYSRISTSTREKNQNYPQHWKVTEEANKLMSAENISKGKFKANEGVHWGKATLIKNFSEEIEV